MSAWAMSGPIIISSFSLHASLSLFPVAWAGCLVSCFTIFSSTLSFPVEYSSRTPTWCRSQTTQTTVSDTFPFLPSFPEQPRSFFQSSSDPIVVRRCSLLALSPLASSICCSLPDFPRKPTTMAINKPVPVMYVPVLYTEQHDLNSSTGFFCQHSDCYCICRYPCFFRRECSYKHRGSTCQLQQFWWK